MKLFKLPQSNLPFNKIAIEKIVGYNSGNEFIRIPEESEQRWAVLFKINIAISNDKIVIDVPPNHASLYFKRLK